MTCQMMITQVQVKGKDVALDSDEFAKELNNEASNARNSNFEAAPPSVPTNSLPKVTLPFPQRLKQRDENVKFQKKLYVFKTLSINLSLVEALLEMSGYAKLMKELVTKRRSMDFETIEVSCSAIMSSNVVVKKDDPGAFTVP